MDLEKKYTFTEEELQEKCSTIVATVLLRVLVMQLTGDPKTDEEKDKFYNGVVGHVFECLVWKKKD